MLLNDNRIRALSVGPEKMLDPFSEGVQGPNVVSFGLTHAGYDLRMGCEVWVFKGTRGIPADPIRFCDTDYRSKMFDCYTADDSGLVILPALRYALVPSLEFIRMPRWLSGTCVGKSTYARCGLIVNTTPAEPNWNGNLTIEVFACVDVVLRAQQGICQMRFEMLCDEPETDYEGKRGKYQGQVGVTPARMKE